MNKPDKSKARAALDQLFSGMAPTDATRASRPGNPFEASADDASAGTGGRGGIEVTLSTRIQLRGYPNANAFMKRMAEAWGLEWGCTTASRPSRRCPSDGERAGCRKSRKSSTDTTCCARRAACRAVKCRI